MAEDTGPLGSVIAGGIAVARGVANQFTTPPDKLSFGYGDAAPKASAAGGEGTPLTIDETAKVLAAIYARSGDYDQYKLGESATHKVLSTQGDLTHRDLFAPRGNKFLSGDAMGPSKQDDNVLRYWRAVASLIPESMRRGATKNDKGEWVSPLDLVDLRPVFSKLTHAETTTVGDIQITDRMRTAAQADLDHAEEIIPKARKAMADRYNIGPDAVAVIETEAAKWEEGKVTGIMSSIDLPATQKAQADATGGATSAVVVGADGTKIFDALATGTKAKVSQADMVALFDQSNDPLANVLNQPSDKGDPSSTPLGDVLMVPDDDVVDRNGWHGNSRHTYGAGLSANQARQFLQSMSDEDVWGLQRKMLKAGLYDGLQIDSLFGTIGDHLAGFDPATIAAYNTLINKTWDNKMSPTQMLGTLTLQYNKQNEANGLQPRFNEKGQPNYDKQGNLLVYNHYGSATPAAHIVTGAAAVYSEAQAKATSRLGHTLNAEQIDDLVKTVRDGEITQANRLSALDTGSGIVEKLTSSDMIDSYINSIIATGAGKDGTPLAADQYVASLFSPEIQAMMGAPLEAPPAAAPTPSPVVGPAGVPLPVSPAGPLPTRGPDGVPVAGAPARTDLQVLRNTVSNAPTDLERLRDTVQGKQ